MCRNSLPGVYMHTLLSCSHLGHPPKISTQASALPCTTTHHAVCLTLPRTNLPQVAGLPPVTKEWFEARKAQLTSATTSPHQKIWYDPLTKKKFQTQNTYQAHVNSKKYQELVRQSGEPAPAPVIMIKQLQEDEKAPAGRMEAVKSLYCLL